MAENKLSWTELRRALASRAGVSEKEANAFLSAFQTQLVEALKQDKQVKVNGLGTFKLQAVAPRKSVNVTTGEEITIEGYNKIAFVPEAGVKELVEKGVQPSAASTQPTEIDPLKKLGTQAEEIVDILGELGQAPEKKAKKKAKGEKKAKVQAEPVAAPEPVLEPEPVVVPEPVKEPEPVVVPEPVKEPEPAKAPEKPKKKYHFLRDVIICVVILLFLLLGGFFFLRHELSNWIDGLVNGKPAQTEVVETPSVVSEQPAEQEAAEEVVTEEPAVAEEHPTPVVEQTEKPTVSEPAVSTSSKYPKLITTEEITYGSRLAWISKKYYGDKIYWPYLYDANRDRIKNPSSIPVGTKIRVPKLTAAQRDTTSASFQQLREEAYSRARN